jgi:hypothetical protein
MSSNNEFHNFVVRVLYGITVFVVFVLLLLCNISQTSTGVPFSVSPRNKPQSGPVLVKLGRNSTCFGVVQSVDVPGWGTTPQSPWGALKHF